MQKHPARPFRELSDFIVNFYPDKDNRDTENITKSDVWDYVRRAAENTRNYLADKYGWGRKINRPSMDDVDRFRGALQGGHTSVYRRSKDPDGAATNLFYEIKPGGHAWRLPAILAWIWARHPREGEQLLTNIREYTKDVRAYPEFKKFDSREFRYSLRRFAMQLEDSADESNASEISEQPLLSEPDIGRGFSHYASEDALDVVGRDEEQNVLRAFAHDKAPFLWMQLAGVAGQGKSRLAFELWRELEKDGEAPWACGLLDDAALKSFAGKWSAWRPDRPHLLIADYVIGAETGLSEVFEGLLPRRDSLENKVRLLLVERQRWDRGGIVSYKPPSEDRASPSIELNSYENALWFAELGNGVRAHAHLQDARYRGGDGSGVIELTRLATEKLVDLALDAIKKNLTDNAIKPPSREMLKDRLAKVDPEGRPLFAYFLGQLLADNLKSQADTRDKVLGAILTKDWSRRWKAPFGEAPPALGDKTEKSIALAVLATIVGGVDAGAMASDGVLPGDPLFEDADVSSRANVLTSGPRDRGAPGSMRLVTPLLPDLLGEWFVIAAIKHGQSKVDIMNLAWSIDPKATAVFLGRLTQDFPDHPVVMQLLEIELPDELAMDAFAEKATAIAKILHKSAVDIPDAIVRGIEHATLLTDPGPAMSVLGYCYLMGRGVEKNEIQSFYWYERSAKKGYPGGIRNIALCYLNGVGVEQSEENDQIAVALLKEGIATREPEGCAEVLGRCYVKGRGVEQDHAEAVKWYQKAADAGNANAMNNLGASYAKGLGVEQDHVEAVKWYQKAADAGNANAMNNLGASYDNGLGVEQDHAEAVRWYQKAADDGNTSAMSALGCRYLIGQGVEKDQTKAVEWLEKAADAGSDAAAQTLKLKGLVDQLLRDVAPRRSASNGSTAEMHWKVDSTPWADRPLTPGDWCDLATHDPQSLSLLEKIDDAYQAQFDAGALDGAVCTAIRYCPTSFYPNLRLVEAQFSLTRQQDNEPRIVTALCSENSAVLMVGKSFLIHILNSRHIELSSDRQFESYLRFFCAHVRSEFGPFYLPTSISEIAFIKTEKDRLPEEILSADFTLNRLRSSYEGRNMCRRLGNVNCGNSIFRSTFTVDSTGDIVMEDDKRIAFDLPILQRRFEGPFRTRPLDLISDAPSSDSNEPGS